MTAIQTHGKELRRLRAEFGKIEALLCPSCGQRGDRPPGLSKVAGGAEAAHFSDPVDLGGTVVALEWIQCKKCGRRWPVAAGTVLVVKP